VGDEDFRIGIVVESEDEGPVAIDGTGPRLRVEIRIEDPEAIVPEQRRLVGVMAGIEIEVLIAVEIDERCALRGHVPSQSRRQGTVDELGPARGGGCCEHPTRK
jgi:hypothetical protein